MSDKVFIYTLTEDGSDSVRYVGQTSNLQTRLQGHLSQRAPEANPKVAWITSVLAVGGMIKINQIEECTIDTANEREMHWINHYKSIGCQLTNAKSGGDYNRMTRSNLLESGPVLQDFGIESNDFSQFSQVPVTADMLALVMAKQIELIESIVGVMSVGFRGLTEQIEALSKHNQEHCKLIKKMRAALALHGIDIDDYVNKGAGI